MTLSAPQITSLLGSNNLKVRKEDRVYEAVWKWYKHDPEKRLFRIRASTSFTGMVTSYDFSQVAMHNKQCHMKVLLSSFHLNGHTLGFHPQT